MRKNINSQFKGSYFKANFKGLLFLAAIFLLLIVLSSNAAAGYAIKLNNESTFLTNYYWEKDGIIRFYAYGGILGFDRQTIRSIKEVTLDISSQPMPAVAQDKELAQENEKKPEKLKTQPESAKKDTPADPKQAVKGEKSKEQIEIEKQIDGLKKQSDKAWVRFDQLPESTTRTHRGRLCEAKPLKSI